MATHVFVNTTDNHFKVWGYDAFHEQNGEGSIILYWGRIGLTMQHLTKKEKHFANWSDAYLYIRNKVTEKICNGYKGIPNYLYFDLIQTATGIATLIGIIQRMQTLPYYEELTELSQKIG